MRGSIIVMLHHFTKVQVSYYEIFHVIISKLQDNKNYRLFDFVEGIHDEQLSQLSCHQRKET